MARWAYLPIAFAGLSAWAGAQNPSAPTPLSAEDRLRLLKANSTLIDNLVTDGVKMANATTPVTKVDYGRQASRSLVNAILEAARNNDAGRVAELTTLFREFVRDGFAPMLKEARESVPPKSPAAEQLADIQTQANKDLTELKGQLSAGEVSANQQVQSAVKQLDELAEKLK